MFGSGAIDVAIGLTFIFALLSLICSSLTESVSQLLRWRAETLEMGIRSMITDPATRDAFYNHPLIKALGKQDATGLAAHPAYMPSRLFALVLLDVVAPVQSDQQAPAQDQAVAGEIRKALRTLTGITDADLAAKRKSVEVWFDDVMDRVSGWYKRKAQWALLFFALVVTCLANADSIRLATTLWQSPALRAAMADAAASYSAGPAAVQKEVMDEPRRQLDELISQGLPLGWAGDKVLDSREPRQWLSKIAGLLLTALAASLGAPFWFDLVNKMVNIRGTGKPPGRSEPTPLPADQPDSK